MYPMLYHSHHLHHMEDITFWAHFASQAGGPILELGCGTGRVLVNLADQGHFVTGVDNDPAMLAHLRTLVPAALTSQVQLFEIDFSEPFDLSIQYPLVILPCNTLSTFYSRYRRVIFENVHRHLAPNGRFIFSIPNPPMLAELDPEGDFELEDTFPHPKTGASIDVFSSWYKETSPEGAPFLTFQWRYQVPRSADQVEILETTTSHILDPVPAYLADLKTAGLAVQNIFGDFDQSAYQPDATYLIVVACHQG